MHTAPMSLFIPRYKHNHSIATRLQYFDQGHDTVRSFHADADINASACLCRLAARSLGVIVVLRLF
jgi:hypothetical protein